MTKTLDWTETVDGHQATSGAWHEAFTYRIAGANARTRGGTGWTLAPTDDELRGCDEHGHDTAYATYRTLDQAKRVAEWLEAGAREAAADVATETGW